MRIKEIKAVKAPYPFESYAHVISPLSPEEGGGFLISFPDLPGCMSDGETIEEAIQNGRDAFLGWISAQADMGREIPKPAYQDGAFPKPVCRIDGRLETNAGAVGTGAARTVPGGKNTDQNR